MVLFKSGGVIVFSDGTHWSSDNVRRVQYHSKGGICIDVFVGFILEFKLRKVFHFKSTLRQLLISYLDRWTALYKAQYARDLWKATWVIITGTTLLHSIFVKGKFGWLVNPLRSAFAPHLLRSLWNNRTNRSIYRHFFLFLISYWTTTGCAFSQCT